MTRPTRKLPGGALGAYQDGETLDVSKLVVAAGNEAVSYAGAMETDFEDGPQQEVTLTGDVTDWTTTNRVAGAAVEIIVDPGSSARTLAFSSSWRWIGTAPTGIAADKLALLRLTVRDTYDESGIIAEWGVEQ